MWNSWRLYSVIGQCPATDHGRQDATIQQTDERRGTADKTHHHHHQQQQQQQQQSCVNITTTHRHASRRRPTITHRRACVDASIRIVREFAFYEFKKNSRIFRNFKRRNKFYFFTPLSFDTSKYCIFTKCKLKLQLCPYHHSGTNLCIGYQQSK